MCGSMKWPMFVMTHDTTAGWPLALGRMNVSTKSRLNMKGWNCSAASRIQNSPEHNLEHPLRPDGAPEPLGHPF